MIQRSYNQPRITRSPTLNMYDDIKNLSSRYIVPAAKTVGKEILKVPLKTLPTIGQGVGLAAGVGATALSGNPELLPWLGTAGGYAGKKGGEYLKKAGERAIDKL